MSEELVLTNLLENDEYARKVIPFLKTAYFTQNSTKLIYKNFIEYYSNYNVAPTHEALGHEISNDDSLTESEFDDVVDTIEILEQDKPPNMQWLLDTTEKFCQDQALTNAIRESISIIDGEDEKQTLTKHALPDLLKDALSVSFDTHIGHDYFEDAKERFEFYSLDLARLPFNLKMFDLVTNGGVPDKTLNIVMAGPNVGKTLLLIHLASTYLMQGKNVLYITMEMAEEAISNRVDANLFDMTVKNVENCSKDTFFTNIKDLRKKTQGTLIVKEYPTSSAHVGHFGQLLQELRLKKNFKPDVIMVDYIGIMASSRVKLANTNSYFYVKAIAEELRGLAVQHKVPLWTATQTNRGGSTDTDVDMTDTAESFGLPATADFMVAVIRTDELDMLNQLMIKQLKSRYGNKNFYSKFVVGVEVEKMLIYDIEDEGQNVTQGAMTTSKPKDDTTPKPKRQLTY